MNVALVVLLIVVGLLLVQAAIWIPLILWWRRRSAEVVASMQSELQLSGERVIAGPESAVYRGASSTYGKVKGNGTIVLTQRRLVFRKLGGRTIEIPVGTITGWRTSKGFLGARTGGRSHLIVITSDPAEVGFFVRDLDAWERHLRSVRPPTASTGDESAAP